MSDLAGVGSEVPAAAPNAAVAAAAAAPGTEGNPPNANGGGSQGSGAAPAAITPSPETENLAFAKAKGWLGEDGTYKTADIVKGYQQLEQHLGKTVVVPDEKATAEEREAFHRRLGWTGKAEDYTFAPPADMPKELPYSSALADAFKSWAIEDKVPVSTAKSFHDRFAKFQVEAFNADVAEMVQQVQAKAVAADAITVKNWGEKGSTKYTENTEASKRAFTDPLLSGLRDELTAAGLLTPKGEFVSFGIAQLLATHGRSMGMNDTFIAPNSGGQTVGNPFLRKLSDGSENPAYNLTTGGAILKQNPNEARRLIQQAGEDPGLYGL